MNDIFHSDPLWVAMAKPCAICQDKAESIEAVSEDMMYVDVELLPECVPFTTAADVPRWYVAYTYPRHEKSVADQLTHKSVETFLPTCNKTSRWKDRQVKIALPLFPGYVFARICASARLTVLSIPSVIRMVSFKGVPVPVSDAEIDAVRLCIGRGATLHPHRFVAVGERVRVTKGVFEGLEGIVVRQNNSCKLVVTIALIHQAVALEIEADLLESIRTPVVPALVQELRATPQLRRAGTVWNPEVQHCG